MNIRKMIISIDFIGKINMFYLLKHFY